MHAGEGVCVQASTLGSLEALLEFLKSPAVDIPVSGIAIGPVHKKDVMRANVMMERGVKKFAVILAFDVPVTKEAREMAEDLGVRIFTADIIYHLFDQVRTFSTGQLLKAVGHCSVCKSILCCALIVAPSPCVRSIGSASLLVCSKYGLCLKCLSPPVQFTAYLKTVREEEQEAAKLLAVFPCILKIMPTCVFNKKDPIVVGVEIMEGIAKVRVFTRLQFNA